jgi:ATP-dependent RNA helicase RhlB
MNLSRFSIDPALFAGSGADDSYKSVFYDKLLSCLFEQNENLFVKTDLETERSAILLFPVLYWLAKGLGEAGKKRALYLCAEKEAAEQIYAEASRLCSLLPGLAAPALLVGTEAPSAEAALVVADLESLAAAVLVPEFQPRSFGFVVADQTDLMAELPGERIRTIQGRLLPSWERKTLVVSAKHTPKAKNFAWDFADDPKEIKLGETMGFAGTMAAVSRDVAEADKIRFILGLLTKVEDRHLCVFCNLKSTATELSTRLAMNGVAADYIAGNLNIERKNQIVAKAMGWTGRKPSRVEPAEGEVPAEAAPLEAPTDEMPPMEAMAEEAPHDAPVAAPNSRFPADSFVLVLTDDGAKGIAKPSFSTVVNYDIPLEPEFYFERLNLLKRDAPDAGLYNLVCERYMYGIPAIERLVDTSLAVVPLEDRASLPADQSAGKSIEPPEPRRRFDRGGRDDRGRGRDFGRGDRRDFPPRTERRDERPGRDDLARRDEPVRRSEPLRRDEPVRRDDSAHRGEPVKRDEPARRSDPTRRDDRRPGRAEAPRAVPETKIIDPYALSMEERMALYRKKYGQAVERSGKPRPNSRPRGPASAGRPRTGEDRPTPRGAPAQVRGPDAGPAAGQAAGPAAGSDSGQPAVSEAPVRQEEKNRGFLGKIQDMFGSKKSE